MNLSIIKSERDLVYNLHLNSDLTSDQVSELFSIEEWEIETFQPATKQANRGSGRRYLIKDSKSRTGLHKELLKTEQLQTIQDYFQSDILKNIIVDTLYENAEFKRLWGISKESLLKITKLTACLLTDLPELHVKIHLDNRMNVAAGMVYFNKESDGSQATVFYTDDQKSNPLEIPTGFQNGWLAANTHNSWHEGFNLASTNRLSIIFNLGISIPK